MSERQGHRSSAPIVARRGQAAVDAALLLENELSIA
jgi:hypothetical protein